MLPQSVSRKNFIKNSSILVAGGAGLLLGKSTNAAEQIKSATSNEGLTLKNVRLETGFEFQDDKVISTKTELFIIEISNGKIKTILPNNSNAKAVDAKGLLMLPAFRDMHIHLD